MVKYKFSRKINICENNIQLLLCFLIFATCPFVHSQIRLPSVIGSGMVLQQNDSAAIWGWDKPGQEVTVTPGWSREKHTASCDNSGKWELRFQTPSAGGPYKIAVRGSSDIILEDVLIGEVWLCSGQSNMEMTVGAINVWQPGVNDWQRELLDADYPKIRFFEVPRNAAKDKQNDCPGQWQVCSSETAKSFTAAGFFFGRKLYKELGIPVGLIKSSYGGTPSQSWTDMDFMRSHEAFKSILEQYDAACNRYPQALEEWKERVKEWEKKVEKAREDGKEAPPKPWEPMGPGNPRGPASLFNGMIHPLISYTLQGVIWYQGEANAREALEYRSIFPAMIENWRQAWNKPDMPFYYVQIAPWTYPEPYIGAELREAQLLTLSLPNTGMVVTTDLVDDIENIHPPDKKPVGERLALWALAKVYGKKNVVYSGPLYKSMKIEKEAIRIFFDHTDGGLKAKGGKLTDFEIAGEDNEFVPAQAVIEDSTVIVRNDAVKEPKNVRFGWSNTARPNLFNKAGLPASTFRTYDLPLTTENK
ncbi:hypothetical protein SMSP2_01368 [Limihaloglobus sulfuriphilus]|uniref:Sialate O-acetylesterase domain-containing protein n=1 Tax=Limihaloglobus sulfuriphilus TaxID=1851148 RepID=A0A1Q2MED3_9BACT|nr:hypothetical protein SMSP2_01368 [Limihaloglobus sulfuriphilus]